MYRFNLDTDDIFFSVEKTSFESGLRSYIDSLRYRLDCLSGYKKTDERINQEMEKIDIFLDKLLTLKNDYLAIKDDIEQALKYDYLEKIRAKEKSLLKDLPEGLIQDIFEYADP